MNFLRRRRPNRLSSPFWRGLKHLPGAVLILLGLRSCINVAFSEDPWPDAAYTCSFEWADQTDSPPDHLAVALARTTKTVHDTCHIVLPRRDTHSVAKGNYYAVAFGPVDTLYRFENLGAFYAHPSQTGLKDLSAVLPLSSGGEGEGFGEATLLCLEHLRQSAPFPVVVQAIPIWCDTRFLRLNAGAGVMNQWYFSLQNMMQRLRVRICIEYDESDLELEGVAVSLNGVPRRLNLLTATVHQGESTVTTSGDSDIASVLVPMRQGTVQGRRHWFEGSVRTLGLFSAINESEIGGWGVADIAVKVRDKDVKNRKVNLFRLMQEEALMGEIGSQGDYRILRSSALLDLSRYTTVVLNNALNMEDEEALEMWLEDEKEDHHLEIIPE